METFEGRLAVVTGGGAGIGREIALQLARGGCSVALCDVSATSHQETSAMARTEASGAATVSSFTADVSKEDDLLAFRSHVESAHASDRIDLLFNIAGIGGGYSLLDDTREQWEKVFNVNWGGVYLGVRTFLPLLLRSPDSRIINMSSVNGFWGGLSPTESLVAYSAAKFAVRGFSEALITDLRLRAPQVGVSVVMPGHVGTSLVTNTNSYLLADEHGAGSTAEETTLRRDGSAASAETLHSELATIADEFRANAPTTAEQAARIILDGVRERRWRILVGEDARILDAEVRADPENAYEPEFYDRVRSLGVFSSMPAPPTAFV
jgi:NAD(P)-dependent dehydrogenase (short-subunit alcohol dehydrogenase family)